MKNSVICDYRILKSIYKQAIQDILWKCKSTQKTNCSQITMTCMQVLLYKNIYSDVLFIEKLECV